MSNQEEWLPTEKNIEDYALLKDMLRSQRKEFDLLSKKKVDGQLNPMKIKMANRVLEPLQELFSHEKSHSFLDTLDEDVMPTYSDVVLVISQYETAITEFKNKYYIYDHFLAEKRWLTEEKPQSYYRDIEEEDYEDGEYEHDE